MFIAPSVEQILQCPPSGLEQFMMMEMKRPWNKSHIEIAPNCPRCASSNTKFCYYNNYSLSQPRYFCKGCRRYWTKGGSLRNIPVGGGCRKNRRGKVARLSQADHGSSSYFQHHNSSTTTEDDLAGNTQPGGSNAPDIDLAVVFAKFLNHNSTIPDGHDHDPNLVISSSALNGRDGSHNSSKADDLVEAVGHHYLHEGHQSQEENIQTFMGINHNDDMNIHEFELQGLLGDDEQVVQDMFWSDDAMTSLTSSTASFTWQPMMDPQELDCSPPSDDDQMKISTNLCGDNWSSFEFSGFEVFSRS